MSCIINFITWEREAFRLGNPDQIVRILKGAANTDVTLYQKMYAIVYGAASDAIDLLRSRENILQAQTLLGSALLRAEEMYLDAEETATEWLNGDIV